MEGKTKAVTGDYVEIDGETYFKIGNSHWMPSFFMSLVGSSDHWMFVSSEGALSAGRCDPDSALFPYLADDQISVARSQTGPHTLIRCLSDTGEKESSLLWNPFSFHHSQGNSIRRNLYKTPLGNKLIFEEVNECAQLSFRYRWAFSDKFGFVRSCCLENLSDKKQRCELLDGLLNVLPYGVGSELMMRFSNLANAYKKSERLEESGIGLFYLSSIPTDRAEPSEGLKATTVWQTGLNPKATMLSATQLSHFEQGWGLRSETELRGTAGAYFVKTDLSIEPGESVDWHIVAELEQDHVDIVGLDRWLKETENPSEYLLRDIEVGQDDLLRIVSSSDGIQRSAKNRLTNRHLANTVFNLMRGGVPVQDYSLPKDDFCRHIQNFNRRVFERHRVTIEALPETITAHELEAQLSSLGDPDLTRLTAEYLPLAFSRRHGDPTRPWNRFAIKLRSEDGGTNLDYQGNWRDLFQNWEALAFSFPGFSKAMVCRFVNATTADGYNPYRVTKHGFEWEEPAPEDPWANIGYWGDHQIIYLLKLLEWARRLDSHGLDSLFSERVFVHANIPYRIKDFEAIKTDPQETIVFDEGESASIRRRVAELGADGKLLLNDKGEIARVTLFEKVLTLSLAKLSNYVPDGGIWLNTQRPEWNDANNALVGNGLSMVTVCYLHRWSQFMHDWVASTGMQETVVSLNVARFFRETLKVLLENEPSVDGLMSPSARERMTELLSQAGSDYRERLYREGLSHETTTISSDECLRFFKQFRLHLASSIRNNRRTDGLFHTYNLLDWGEKGIEIASLYEMLEGQVAVMSAGILEPTEAVDLLDSLRDSRLYREDQNSYLLYPDRQLPTFLEKNRVASEEVSSSPLLLALLEEGDESIVHRDADGVVHFNGRFRNAGDLKQALLALPTRFQKSVLCEQEPLVSLFIDTFGHREFTGRSGTFFAYEGLGSIYWHMVSKLLLAVSENFFRAIDRKAPSPVVTSLQRHFKEIRRGIGAEKRPEVYGAFPTDPYSHTPEQAGAKQPGMTGQVKEDFLSRFMELGLHVDEGEIHFRFDLVDPAERVSESSTMTFINLRGETSEVIIPNNGYGFTFCQVPIVVQAGAESNTIEVIESSGSSSITQGLRLPSTIAGRLFARRGDIMKIVVRHT